MFRSSQCQVVLPWQGFCVCCTILPKIFALNISKIEVLCFLCKKYLSAWFETGDPLSPMLFILVMDVLHSLFLKANELGLLQPLLRQGNGQRVSLYADDAVAFLKPNRNSHSGQRNFEDLWGGFWSCHKHKQMQPDPYSLC
jgi:hypothetical protein